MFHYSISVFSMHFTINCYRKEWTCITHNKSNRTKNIIKGVRRCGGKRIKKKRSIELKKNKRKQKRGEWKSRAQNEIGVEAGWTETFVSAESNGNGRRENIFIGRMFSFRLVFELRFNGLLSVLLVENRLPYFGDELNYLCTFLHASCSCMNENKLSFLQCLLNHFRNRSCSILYLITFIFIPTTTM